MAAPHEQTEAQTDEEAGSAREQLLRAGERLFARDGIHRVKLREINDLAGQRNPSAVHYHFGTREGLVDAILQSHQGSIDLAIDTGLDELEASGRPVALRDIVATVVHPLVGKLETESGRDFLRIVPQVIPQLSANLRHGVAAPATPQSRRVLELLRGHWGDLPEAVQRERQIAYILMLTAMLADRAHQVGSGWATTLDAAQFEEHVLDMIAGALGAPSGS
ncbi:MAG: TetR/AcrR family transcriptional regulator [Actinomycetia bacterium]|nr:TetR/AcrR family transcriptional regulator [Actinomycetes bacterium]